MVLSKKVVVKAGGIHGFCWFAGEDIKAGEMLWQMRSEPDAPVQAPYLNYYRNWEQIQQMSEKTRTAFLDLAYQVDDDAWLGIDPDATTDADLLEIKKDLYINHSCDCNAWHRSDSVIEARRDIPKGEEITYDYALTESDETWILAERCLCGTADCRGKVGGSDWRLPKVQAKYGRHFLTYLLRKIDALNAANSTSTSTSTSTGAIVPVGSSSSSSKQSTPEEESVHKSQYDECKVSSSSSKGSSIIITPSASPSSASSAASPLSSTTSSSSDALLSPSTAASSAAAAAATMSPTAAVASSPVLLAAA